MSSYHIVEDIGEETSISSKSTFNNNTNLVQQQQIEKKHTRTVGNFNVNGTPLTTTATTSSAKFSVTSTAVGKAVVSSLSMSLERKDCIHYMPRKIPPCIIPAGQNTVIHLDNYTHFMAQRVTTTKTAFKRSELITESQDKSVVPSSTSSAGSTAAESGSVSRSVGIVDLKVILSGVPSYSSSTKKAADMHKQKMLESKTNKVSKMRGRKNSLPLECSQSKERNKILDIKEVKPHTSTPKLKSILKKPKPATSRRKKVAKPIQTKKVTIENEELDQSAETSIKNLENLNIITSPETTTKKILKPCINTLQNKKCPSEMKCSYLHSDFPCKYYYLNLHCPQGVKCQYMHNGPLEENLMDALRTHILDLLSSKPHPVETHFIQQLHNIEDLTLRLQSFQNKDNQIYEIIEVMDDGDEDQVLVIDESSCDVNTNNSTDFCTNPSTKPNEIDNPTASDKSLRDKYDVVYENFKETNTIIDELDQKLQNLKSTSNMTANEKIHELQNIYELLKEQEKRLPVYENLNATAVTGQMSTIFNNNLDIPNTNLQNDQNNIVLVNPEIVNEIQMTSYEENIINVNDDDNSQSIHLNVPQNDGIECINDETLLPENEIIESLTIEEVPETIDGTEFLNNEYLVQQGDNEFINNQTSPFNANGDSSTLCKENEVHDNDIILSVDEDDDSTTNKINNNEIKESNLNLVTEENGTKNTENNEDNSFLNPETIESNLFENEKFEMESQLISEKNIDQDSTLAMDERNDKLEDNVKLNNTLVHHNETLELALNLDEKEIIEKHIEDMDTNNLPVEEESPPYENIKCTKPEKQLRIRLRSHTHLDTDTALNTNNSEQNTPITSLEPVNAIKPRRLRLPKPTHKTNEKVNNKELQINAEIINKLIESSEHPEPNEINNKSTSALEVEEPLTQNVILTKRFIKKAKAKLEQKSQLNETSLGAGNDNLAKNVEENMLALHSGNLDNINNTENIDSTPLTQTSSDDSHLLNSSQNSLQNENECDQIVKLNNEISTSNSSFEKSNLLANTTTKRRISFENPCFTSNSSLNSTSPKAALKEKFNLGNPQVVLAKLKVPFVQQTFQNIKQADSTTDNNVNSIVTSSNLLADDQTTQKRHSLTPDFELDSSLKENKCIKIDNGKSVRKVNFETNRNRTYSGHSSCSTSKDNDFDTDSSDEMLTIADALQTGSSSSNNNEVKQRDFEPSTSHVETRYSSSPTTSASHREHNEEQENESDLRQQIENVSNKSDLNLQEQQLHKHQQQQKDVERFKITNAAASSSITKNGNNNLPHKQYQRPKETTSRAIVMKEEFETELHSKQYKSNSDEEKQIENTCNPYANTVQDNGHIQSSSSTAFERINESDKITLNANDKYSNENLLVEQKEIAEYTTYSSLYNKLSTHSTKCQINFQNSSVNITPISSPTYGDDTIASPSPVRRFMDYRLGGEIDGRLTYPPMPYILHEIDLSRIDINKPLNIDKLKKTIYLDPRIFRTHIKRPVMTTFKPIDKLSNALVPLGSSYNAANLPFGNVQPNASMISPYDPRNRIPGLMTDIVTPPITQQTSLTPSMTHQTALTPYGSINTAMVPSTSSSSGYMHPEVPNAVPLALQYHTSSQPILQPQQQQTPNMFLYGCLQRSPWYQSLMSTMKIQINQSISHLVRALNNFHRERLLNPELVFDVFKIDCAGELLEIMRNLAIFVDGNGIINEKRHVPTFGGQSCCNPTMPVNATYSFIQQVLTPNTHCTSMATSSSSAGGGAPVVGTFNVNEPFVSCYIKAPEPPVKKCSEDNAQTTTTQNSQYEDNNCNRHCNSNNNNSNNNNNNGGGGCCCSHNCSTNNNNNNSNSYNQNNNNNRRFGGSHFKKPYESKPYDNNNGGSGGYQQRSNQRFSSYSNNPRFHKPGTFSPSKSNSSPPNSPKGGGGFDGGNGGSSYGGGGGGGRGGFFNKNKRFNNNDRNFNSGGGGGGSSWSSDSNDKPFNKFQNNSPNRSNSPSKSSSGQSGSPVKTSSTPPVAPVKKGDEEEDWD